MSQSTSTMPTSKMTVSIAIEHISRHAKTAAQEPLDGGLQHKNQIVKNAKGLTLACLETTVGLVDDISAAATTDHAIIPVTVFERLQAIADLHDETLPNV